MKLLLILAFFVSFQALAFDVCSYQETWNVEEAFEDLGVKPVRTSSDHKRFNSVEKHLIHKTLKYLGGENTMAQALEAFADMWEGESGSNAGVIVYYNIQGKQYVVVRYYPGDTEVGAYYSINRNGSFKLEALIDDGSISCK